MSFIREPDAEPLPGYRLIEPLGSGGFGEVWKCEAPGGLFKAIKFVYGNLNSLDVEGARAEQEFKALERIKEVRHPFVLSLERIENVEGELVIVMELADKSLHDLYQECQSAGLVGIPRDDLMRYVRDAAEALDHMNEKHGLQHLDVKPRNLFLISDRVKVADFGLVKHLERQSASGLLGGVTPLYAPPETFTGKISERSDQYSLAIVYMELLTGQRPFHGKNVRQLAQQHLQAEPELRGLPEAERPVVARALAKDPAKRFPSCLAFVRALYTARAPARVEVPAAEAGRGLRPRTMAETMEDVLLIDAPAAEPPPPPPEPAFDSGEAVSQLGITQAQPQTGALRPTVIVGVGAFGRRALLELRCRFVDRFGDLDKVPLVRFLYLDCDSDALRESIKQTTDVAFRPDEVYHLPLQPAGHYRRRQLDQLTDWLPREKLYALPRSLKPQGSRALGRLAFADNYLRLAARLKREVQQAAHPDALYQSVSQTGLALRDNEPRVYVIAGAGGGGSGFLTDLGYALRRLLQQLRHPEAHVTAFVFCGAPDDPATPRPELANLYATLTELNHFADPVLPFAAQYGTDGPRVVEQGQPFDCAYLLTAADRSPEARRETVAHLGSYLFHELTTPLGLRLDRERLLTRDVDGAAPTLFRSFGTYAVWFPRGLLLRLAGRAACRRLLEDWQAAEPSFEARAAVEAACARVLADPGLRPEVIAARVEEAARAHLNGTPGEALTALLAGLEEQSQQFLAQDDPGGWAKQALNRVREWLGGGVNGNGGGGRALTAGSGNGPRASVLGHRSPLTRALEAAAQTAAEEWDARMAEAVFGLMDHPGRRVAAAEAAFARLLQACDEAATAHLPRLEQQAAKVQQVQESLQGALANCISGGGAFSFFGGGRPRRLLRVFMDLLAAFARQCLAEDQAGATQQFYHALHGRLADRLRDLSFCRQRLRALQESLECSAADADDFGEPPADDLAPSPSPLPSTEAFWEAIRQSATTRVVLPEGEPDLQRAAQRFLGTVTAEQWTLLDQRLQDEVLGPLGGTHRALLTGGDLSRTLARPLVERAAACLGEHLPITDVAQVVLGEGGGAPGLPLSCLASAAPLVRAEAPRPAVAGPHGGAPAATKTEAAATTDFLLVPASEAGRAFGELAKKAAAGLHLVRVPGQADLMFCREQGYLSLEDVQRLLRPCRAAYQEAALTPATSPHARADIVDWVPLDP